MGSGGSSRQHQTPREQRQVVKPIPHSGQTGELQLHGGHTQRPLNYYFPTSFLVSVKDAPTKQCKALQNNIFSISTLSTVKGRFNIWVLFTQGSSPPLPPPQQYSCGQHLSCHSVWWSPQLAVFFFIIFNMD